MRAPRLRPSLLIPCLEQHWLSLLRARERQRTRDREEFALVVQRVLFRLVQEDPGLLVAWESVVLVAVPQPADHLHELMSATVAHGVVEVLLAAVVAGCAFEARGHHVPARAALGDVVQRGEQPGDVVRLPVRGGERGDQADLGGGDSQRRQQRQRLQAIQEVRRGVGRDERAVDQEDKVEFRLLCQPRVVDEPVDVDAGVSRQLRIAPAQLVVANTDQHRA